MDSYRFLAAGFFVLLLPSPLLGSAAEGVGAAAAEGVRCAGFRRAMSSVFSTAFRNAIGPSSGLQSAKCCAARDCLKGDYSGDYTAGGAGGGATRFWGKV